MSKKYDNEFKYKVIKEYCNGKTLIELGKEYGLGKATPGHWVRQFVKKGPFEDLSKLTPDRLKELEKVREKAQEKYSPSNSYTNEFKYKVIEEYCDDIKITELRRKYGMSHTTILNWFYRFVEKGLFEGSSKLTPNRLKELEKLREKAKEKSSSINSYTNEFKYKVIEEYCNGKSADELGKNYGLADNTARRWFLQFVKKGPFEDLKELSPERLRELEKLKDRARTREKTGKIYHGQYSNELKYKVIEGICDRKLAKDVAKEYGVSRSSAMQWFYQFLEEGPFKELRELSPERLRELEKLRDRAKVAKEENSRFNKVYENEFKYIIIEELCDGKTGRDLEREYNISKDISYTWIHQFVEKGPFEDLSELSSERLRELEELRDRARIRGEKPKKNRNSYSNEFKYKVIKDYGDGIKTTKLEIKYKISIATIMKWVRRFIKKGSFEDSRNLTPNRLRELEELRNKVDKCYLETKQLGETKDLTLSWVNEFDEELEKWRELAECWVKTKKRAKQGRLGALSKFFKAYLIPNKKIQRDPTEFLKKEYNAPNFYEVGRLNELKQGREVALLIDEFIDWILIEKYNIEDDYGTRYISPMFGNPLKKYIPASSGYSRLNKSNKNVLPMVYINEALSFVCPQNATSFSDLNFAINATVTRVGSQEGDWFMVNKSLIDKNDPDCVFRKRKLTKEQQQHNGLPKEIYEMWSPVRTMAIVMKLQLPFRTAQVRWLDSGEMDTEKYVQDSRMEAGHWERNNSKLCQGTKKAPFEKGVFRKFYDDTNGRFRTGFFVNTNKTADINKKEDQRGYDVKWEFLDVLFWLAKLRDWQMKYNPVKEPTLWENVDEIYAERGSATFLFRDPVASSDKNCPISDGKVSILWHKVLAELEQRVNIDRDIDDENYFHFLINKRASFYPLHSLRVSLITAYILDGGVPIHILSKAIAGHATVLMTLYYTKLGIHCISNMMDEAGRKILENEQESLKRKMRESNSEDLKNFIVAKDEIAVQNIIDAQESWVSIIKGNIGFCTKGNCGCYNGGIFLNEETGKKTTYGPVPGYPKPNCVRCRWFVTGPAFLYGLTYKFNVISYEMKENGKKLKQYEEEVIRLEQKKCDYEKNNQKFTEQDKLTQAVNLKEQESKKNEALAIELNETGLFIKKCMKIVNSKDSKDSNSVQFVSSNSVEQVSMILSENENNDSNNFKHLQILCNGAEFYPEEDVSKAIMQRNNTIDRTLIYNGFPPILLKLSEEAQLKVGNQLMKIMIKLAGSFEEAIPYAIGEERLEKLGYNNDFAKELQAIVFDKNREDMLLKQDIHINDNKMQLKTI